MIIAILGKQGMGKTLLMTALLKRYHDKGYKVITNYGVTFTQNRINKQMLLQQDDELTNGVVALDEIHILGDSYVNRGKKVQLLSYFFTQLRKREIDLIYTTQHFNTVQKRIRQNTDIVIKSLGRLGNTDYFKYTLLDNYTGQLKTFRLDAKEIYKYYDTTEIIKDFDDEMLSVMDEVKK